MKKIVTILLIFIALASASPASAIDNSWITNPSLSAIRLTGTGITGAGSSYALSTQALHPVMAYDGGLSQAGKFAQVSFFDFTGNMGLELTSGTNGVSSTACDHQTLGGNSHTCFFRMDDQGKASFSLTLSNTSVDAHFKFLVLAGPNITQSGVAQVSFVRPLETIAAVSKGTRGMAGGAGVVQFKVLRSGLPAPGITVNLRASGVGENLSASTATSDSRGLVVVYLSNFAARAGTGTITASVLGGSSSAQAKILWSKVSFAGDSMSLPNTGSSSSLSALTAFSALGLVGLGAGVLTLTRAMLNRR